MKPGNIVRAKKTFCFDPRKENYVIQEVITTEHGTFIKLKGLENRYLSSDWELTNHDHIYTTKFENRTIFINILQPDIVTNIVTNYNIK